MHQDLIERYIYAVIKTLPTRMREDVERELHSLISDMLEDGAAPGGPAAPPRRKSCSDRSEK